MAKKLNLRKCNKIVNRLDDNLTLKRELISIKNEINNLIVDSKDKNANKDYFNDKIKNLIKVYKTSVRKIK